jgi:predicted nucleic acid-binding protein
MNDKPFFDTNIILYAFRRNDPRGVMAESLRAKCAGASTFYTEDMRDGQAIDGLTIRNPFSR